VELLQALHCTALRRIGDKPPLAEALLVKRDYVGRQMFRARLSTAKAAAFMASESDGWAGQIMPMSSAEPRNSIATTASAISSPAIGPMMCTPRISSVVLCEMNLTRPDVSPSARALAFAENGNVPALYSTPSVFNCC